VLTRDRRHHFRFRFATGDQALIPPGQAVLRRPRLGDHSRRRSGLTPPEGVAHEGTVAVLPGCFDEYPTEVGVARLRDATARAAPARSKTASWPASRRSVLIRSPARHGMSAGAMISHAIPRAARARWSSNPPGHLFEPAETALLTELIALVMKNAWDAHVLCSRRGRADALRAKISHDEWYELMGQVAPAQ
jgi:hypothetical protein